MVRSSLLWLEPEKGFSNKFCSWAAKGDSNEQTSWKTGGFGLKKFFLHEQAVHSTLTLIAWRKNRLRSSYER
jgi:hypothetical protein